MGKGGKPYLLREGRNVRCREKGKNIFVEKKGTGELRGN